MRGARTHRASTCFLCLVFIFGTRLLPRHLTPSPKGRSVAPTTSEASSPYPEIPWPSDRGREEQCHRRQRRPDQQQRQRQRRGLRLPPDGHDLGTRGLYLKASNAKTGGRFGQGVALSADTLAIGAPGERSDATGVDGDQDNNNAGGSGAVYIFSTQWRTQGRPVAATLGEGRKLGRAATTWPTPTENLSLFAVSARTAPLSGVREPIAGR